MAALDIGSSKVTCLISRRGDATDGEPRVAGAGAQGTKGVRSGAVVDLDNLERSIRLAVEQAERAADIRISEVVLGVSGPDLRSDVVRAKLPMGGREITAQHIRDARIAALESFQPQGREILHSAPLGFTVDFSTGGIKDPRGMFAEALTASFLVRLAQRPACATLSSASPAPTSSRRPSWPHPSRLAWLAWSRTKPSRAPWSSISGLALRLRQPSATAV